MNSVNFESSKFEYFLHKMADDSFNISSQKEKLIVKKKTFPSEGSLEDRIKGVVNYVNCCPNNLNKHHLQLIKKIQNKLSMEATGQNQEIQHSIKPYLDKLESILNSTNEQKIQSLDLQPPIFLQIAAPPQNKSEFEANLQLVLEKFPRYQLHNDLSVFDSIYKSMPQNWNFDLMHKALQAEFNKYEITEESSKLSPIKQDILSLLKVPLPIQMGVIIETSPENIANAAMLNYFAHLVAKGIPCLVNRHFFQAQSQNFKQLPKLNLDVSVDIYVHKKVELCVVIPKGKFLKDLGINSDCLEISKGEHLTSSGFPLQIAQDIQTLLINETEKHRFFRLIELNGHGLYPKGLKGLDLTKQGTIAGLPIIEFQQTLSSLKEKNMVFMSLNSCFSGGTNSTDIHLTDHTISCPIYIQSSFDTVTRSILDADEYDTTPILDEVQKMMFPPRNEGVPFIAQPRQLAEVDRQKLSLIMNISNPANKFTNLGTLLLPSNKKDIPKVAYTLANPEQILDVSSAYRKAENKPRVLEDKHLNRKAYLFSDPIVPFSLSVSGDLPMILLSRGGTNHHILKEISAPKQSIEDIARETFNAFESILYKSEDQPASKAFFIGNLKCQYDGKGVNLSSVMITNNPEERSVLFQLEGEKDFHQLHFKSSFESSGYPWKINQSEIVNLKDALQKIYLAVTISTPSSKALLQTTAGKESLGDFIEALDQFFFHENIPASAKLYSALLKDSYHHLDQASELKKTLSELKLSITSREEFFDILDPVMDMALDIGFPNFYKIIVESTSTPLIQAILEGNNEQAKTILQNSPEVLEDEDIIGNTALLVALSKKNFELARWLIERGADLYHSNESNYTSFGVSCEFAETDFIEWILQNKGDFKGIEGGIALCDVIERKNWKMVHFLIDNFVGSETDPLGFSFLALAVENSSNQDIIKKLLKYPGVDINQTLNDELNTSLHISVESQDLEILKLLLDQGADPNRKNEKLISPLHNVSIFGQENALELAKVLLEAGANINSQDNKGMTPLHCAVENQKKTLTEFLIRRGASLQVEDNEKQNPLERAAKFPGLLEFILQIPGIDINPKNCKLDKLFQQAMMKGNLGLGKLLILHGVDINKHVENSEPPLLHYLRNLPANTNPIPVLQFFIDHGADLALQDSQGNTVMHLTMEKQDLNILKCLKEAKIPCDKPINKRGESPISLGFAAHQNYGFLVELFQDKDFLKRDIPVIMKSALEKWGVGRQGAVFMLMQKIINDLKEQEGSKISQSSLFYNALSMASLDKNVGSIKEWLSRFKQVPGKKIDNFFGLPPLHAALYLGMDSDDKTRDILISLIKQFPECILEKYIKLPTQLTQDLTILKTLIKQGAEIDSIPVFDFCDLELIKLLDEKGIDLSGEAGLHFLKQFVSKEYTRADQGAGIIFLLSKIQQSVHSALALAIIEGAKDEILNSLIDHPHMNFQKTDLALGSPLYCAIDKLNVSVVKNLISKNAIYEPPTNQIDSPFIILTVLNESDELIEIAKSLMTSSFKAQINEGGNVKSTPLNSAIAFKRERLTALLINHGADVNLPDDAGNTSLHKAVQQGTASKEDPLIPLISQLISKGAKWDIPNKEGLTAKKLAIKLRLGKILQLMQ
jgi:ankyrin repeat protein